MKSFGALTLAASLWLSSAAVAETTLLTNVTVVDVETGSLAQDVSLLIRDGVIAEMGDATAAGDAVVVDGGDGFLIPGLWDSHVHIFSTPDEPETALPLYLVNGITGVRDMGALWPIGDQQALQARIEAGETSGQVSHCTIRGVGPVLAYVLMNCEPEYGEAVAAGICRCAVSRHGARQ